MLINLNKPGPLVGQTTTDGTTALGNQSPASSRTITESQWATELTKAVEDGSDVTVEQLLSRRDEEITKRVDIEMKEIDRRDNEERNPENRRTERQTVQGEAHEGLFGTDALIRALFIAIEGKKSAIATKLIRAKGARLHSPNPANDTGRTPLHEAVRRGDDKVVSELLRHLEHAWYIDKGDKNRRAALHEAAARGNNNLVRLLLQNSANANIRDDYGMTPLHLMVWWKKYVPNEARTLLTCLVDFDAEVNTKDKDGSTPLHDACKNGDRDMTHALLSCGADAGVKNAEGDTPRDVIPRDKPELYQLFEKPWKVPKRQIVANVPTEKPVLSENRRRACDKASVYVRYYWTGHDVSWATSMPVSKLIYRGSGLDNTFQHFRDSMRPSDNMVMALPQDDETWKWIHFSANNMTWIKDLIWLITHSPGYDPREAPRVWSFWERTLNSRQSSGAESIRVPHAEDSWEEDGRQSDHIKSQETHLEDSADPEKLKDKRVDGPKLDPENSDKNIDSSTSRPERSGDRSADNSRDMPGTVWEKAGFEERKGARTFPKNRMLSLVLPFIDFEPESYLDRNETYINWVGRYLGPMQMRMLSGYTKKVMHLIDCYSPYTGRDGLQCPKTLDESYYDMLGPDRIAKRDRDQVILKWFRMKKAQEDERADGFMSLQRLPVLMYDHMSLDSDERSRDEERKSVRNQEVAVIPEGQSLPENGSATTGEQIEDIDTKEETKDPMWGGTPKLLMVHQLWLWKLDDNTVITCCPDRCHLGSENTLFDTIRQSGIELMQGPDDLIERIVCECATFLNEFRSAGLGRHILDIFDTMIGNISHDEITRFKEFKEYMDDIKEKRKKRKKSHPMGRTITDEISLLYEIKDIRDELSLLRRIFEAQYGVLENFSRLFWPGQKDQSRRCREGFLEDCDTKGLIDRTIHLDEDAKKPIEGLDRLVQVKQAQTSLDEAEAARRLNNYIVLFTIVTIIFTPLSFMTGLFAVPVKQFPHDSSSELSYESTWFAGRMLAGEITTLAVVAVIIVFQQRSAFLEDLISRVPPRRFMFERSPVELNRFKRGARRDYFDV